jgi:hypothetical protein
MQNRKFRKMELGQNVGGNNKWTSETHSKASLPIAGLQTALFAAAVVIYDHVLGFIIRGGKTCICRFVHEQLTVRNALASKTFL